jgi:hypothetical protein
MKIIDGKGIAAQLRAELKEKIDKQIIIKKEKIGGSTAKIVVNE